MKTDVLIVGAGFAGMVMAERISNELGKKCLVLDRRDHIGGNAYDYKDEAGVLVHRYGPHLFHTNSDRIFEYLSKFTKWHPATYNAKSFTDGRFWSFPINLQTQHHGRDGKVPSRTPCGYTFPTELRGSHHFSGGMGVVREVL